MLQESRQCADDISIRRQHPRHCYHETDDDDGTAKNPDKIELEHCQRQPCRFTYPNRSQAPKTSDTLLEIAAATMELVSILTWISIDGSLSNHHNTISAAVKEQPRFLFWHFRKKPFEPVKQVFSEPLRSLIDGFQTRSIVLNSSFAAYTIAALYLATRQHHSRHRGNLILLAIVVSLVICISSVQKNRIASSLLLEFVPSAILTGEVVSLGLARVGG